MIYKITPIPKPRQTQSDKWRKRPCVVKYRAFADLVRLHGIKIKPGDHIKFYIPMPKSWSDKKKTEMIGKPHQQKPDIDNYLKALFDAIYKNDSHIWYIGSVKKIWSDSGRIEIRRRSCTQD